MQEGDTGDIKGVALTPPMGFNSYDSYDWTMNETELMRSAQAMQKLLLPSGYNTLTLDWYWYRDGRQITRTLPKVGLPTNTSVQIFFDEFGRVYPDPHRFPSTAVSKGWRPVTDKLAEMGLYLGLHLMPGVPSLAVEAGCTVPGLPGKRLSQLVDYSRKSHGGAICPNCTFYQLNMSKDGSQQWYDAYYAQLASWNIRYIKADFLPADRDRDNLQAMARAIAKTEAPIVLNTHGVSSVAQAKDVGRFLNSYRITSDVHDNWGAVLSGFSTSQEYAQQGLEGAVGLQGKSWPVTLTLTLTLTP